MCGVAGLVDRAGNVLPILEALLTGVAHRGPDDAGIWVDMAHGVGLGHRRLSIIDTSPAGHQPMASVSARYHLTYNGEIYNYAGLRTELELSGRAPQWRGHSDTEVLLAGFETWGIVETLRRCNGMFALAVWDRERKTLTLARDRMGEKPLYFGRVQGRFCFASELKAMAAMPGWRARMAPDAIASFLSTGYVRGPQSAVEGILRLPPGCVLTLGIDELDNADDWAFVERRIEPFWSLHDVALASLSSADVPDDESLHTLLFDAVRLRMTSDVPIGAFLSGGIDSSLVVALMQAAGSQPVCTFSIGFREPAFDEAPHARAVAAHLGTNHTELYVDANDALALVPGLAETFDEPFADSSQLPTLLVAQLARQSVTVALSGDGGDELFGGYGRYVAVLRLWSRLGRVPRPVRSMMAPILSGCAALPVGDALSLRLRRMSRRMDAPDADALRLMFVGAPGHDFARHSRYGNIEHCIPPAGIDDTLRRLMYADQLDYLPDDILYKVDRAAMHYALETRPPLLDHRVVEAAWRLPTSLLIDGETGKQPLRRMLERYIPRGMFERPKQGFAPPMDAWLRGPLREWADALLTREALDGIPSIDARRVTSLWHRHRAGKSDAGFVLWQLLMLSDWRRRFGALI
jgi:asparagine synthase (glutamine-hydrolysing)